MKKSNIETLLGLKRMKSRGVPGASGVHTSDRGPTEILILLEDTSANFDK